MCKGLSKDYGLVEGLSKGWSKGLNKDYGLDEGLSKGLYKYGLWFSWGAVDYWLP